jgi:hypothetical protein
VRGITQNTRAEEKVNLMDSGGLNTGLATPAGLVEQKLRAEQIVKSGAGWFLAIAGLSIVNSIMTMSGTSFHFIFGLGVTQIVDAIGAHSGTTGSVLGLIVNLFVAGIFAGFWYFGKQGQRWAFLVGMTLYLIDGMILLPFHDWLGAGFHAWALYRIYNGMQGIPILENVRRMTVGMSAPITPV